MAAGRRRLLRLLWSGFAWITITTAVLVTAARLFLPLAAHYKTQIVAAVEQALGRPVQVRELSSRWHGFGPQIELKGVQLLSKPGGKPLLSFTEARMGIDVWASLLQRRLVDSRLTVTGVDITLVRRKDGRLGVEGFGNLTVAGAAGRRRLEQVQAWLQAQRRVTIADSDVYLNDARSGTAALHFSHVTLALANRQGRHRLSGSVILPPALGRTLTMAFAFEGPLLQPARWSGDGYFNGAGLQLPGPGPRRAYGGITVADGAADIRAWGRIRDGVLADLTGQVQMSGLKLVAAGDKRRRAQLAFKALGGRFHWRRRNDGWTLDADRVWLAQGDRVTPRTGLRIFTHRDRQGSELEVHAGYLNVADAAALITLSGTGGAPVVRAVRDLRPTGILRHAYLHLDRPRNGPVRPYLYVQFADLHTRGPWHSLPAVGGLTGVIAGSPSAGYLELDSRSVTLPKGPEVRRTLDIDRLAGRIDWQRRDGLWQVSTPRLHLHNADMTVDARFAVKGGHGLPRPFVDLVMDVRDVDIGHLSRYLPAARMRPHNVQWLDRALVNGRVTSGGAVLHGNLADFPFDRNEGVFQVRLNVENGILDFNPRWPRIEEIQAEVRFDGRSMAVSDAQGKMLNSTISRAKVRIANLAGDPAVLNFDGDAAGPTRDALYVATHTPLEGKVGHYLKGATVGGHSALSLAMRLPLMPAPKPQLQGRLTFQGGTLALGEKIRLTDINGPLTFTHDALRSDGIRARMVGYPATITAGTDDRAGSHVIYFAARGQTDAVHIRQLKFIDLPFLRHVHGRTRWRARLQLGALLADGQSRASLKIHSALAGLVVDLPAPLAKAKGDTVPLAVTMSRLGQQSTPVTFRYGNRLSGAFVTESAGIGRGIQRGQFRFGDGAAVLPRDKGIHVDGKLERFSLSEWRGYFPAGQGAGAGMLDRLVDLNVQVGELKAFGWQLHKLALKARKGPQSWSAKVNSNELAGTVQWPLLTGHPLVADMEYVHLKGGDLQNKGRQPDPGRFPPMRITSKAVTYAGKAFGSLKLNITERPGGVHVDRLKVDSDVMKISATGDWTKGKQGQYSAFAANISTQDIGKTLSRFGYVGTIKGGQGDVQLSAAWSGSPMDMDVKTLVGSLSLKLSKGRLLDVDPGAGRILGILSLQALPRRLTLDFSDLFEKGFSFDSMKGDFAIRDGQAYTDDLTMDGPSARVDVAGRVGLVSHDYDQTVTVTPHLTGGLPIAGVIASGVGVGVAILLFQKIFEDQIEELTQARYTIKGPWKKPVVQPLKKEAKSGNGGNS